MEGFNYNEYKNRTRGVESGGNDRAKNPNSSASGRFQFIEDTWKRYGYDWKDRFNPQLQEEAMKRFTEDNINYFKNTFKKEPSYADAYGMHFLGAGGYRKVYTAPANTPIQDVVSEDVYSSNKSVFSKHRTVGEFKKWLSSKTGQPATNYSGQENNETSTYKEVSVPNVTMEGKTAEPYMTLPPSEKAEEAKKQIQEYQQIEDLIAQMPIAQEEEQVVQEVQQQPEPTFNYLTDTNLFTIQAPQIMQEGGRFVNVEKDNIVSQYNTNSQEYRELYNTGNLAIYDKNTDTYLHPPMDELEINVEAPEWVKYKREYEKNNPKRDYIKSYLTPLAKGLGNTETNYPKRLDDEYEQKSLDYVSEQLVKNKPQGEMTRAEWLNSMSDKEEELIKRNPKYQSSLWADTKRGLTSLAEENLAQTFQNILTSSDYSNREKQEMLKDYVDHPMMSSLGDLTKILSPVTVGSKALQSIYRDDTTLTGALRGEKNNASFAEDALLDLTNLTGVGLGKNVAKGLGKATIKSIDDLGSKYLPNAHKSNPFAFKPDPDAYYRMIGKDGYKDAIESGVIRKPKDSRYSVTSFAEGKVLDNEYKGPYMVQAKDKAHFKPDFPGEVATRYDIPIDSPDITMYKQDWLRGYKEVPKSSPKSDDVGSIFKGTLTDKEKEMYQWFEKKQKLDALPKTTNKKTLGVLEDFKTRIQTPEGKKRMKELGIDSDKMLQKIQIVEDPNTFGYFSGDRNRAVLNPLDPLPTQTARHEIEHGVQNAFREQAIKNEGKIIPTLKRLATDPLSKKPLPKSITEANTKIDDLLSGLELRKQGTPDKQWIGHVEQDSPVDISEYKSLISNKQNATDYFLTGSEGREKSAFLGEVQQYMMDNNIIPKTSYTEVTPEMVKNTFVQAMFDETGGGKYLRLFNIMKPSEANYKLISKGLNKMLGLIPPAAVIGTATQSQQNKTEQ